MQIFNVRLFRYNSSLLITRTSTSNSSEAVAVNNKHTNNKKTIKYVIRKKIDQNIYKEDF